MNLIKTLLTRLLLAALNTRWLNPTPCRYGFLGNADAFDLESLRERARARPELTLREFIAEAESFAAHPLTPILAVVENGGEMSKADAWDYHDLRLTVRDPEEWTTSPTHDSRTAAPPQSTKPLS
jgi:hypothetical protein